MTQVLFCKSCEGTTDFIHTDNGIICTGCHEPAVMEFADPIVPFGLTRQLEELDRMMNL